MPVSPSQWRKRGSTKKLQRLVLRALREGRAMTSHEVASELSQGWLRVCGALNDLMAAGQVDLDGNHFRRTA